MHLPNPSDRQHISYLTKVKEPSLPNYLFIAVGRKDIFIHAFPKDINIKLNVNSLIQDLNSGHQFHFL